MDFSRILLLLRFLYIFDGHLMRYLLCHLMTTTLALHKSFLLIFHFLCVFSAPTHELVFYAKKVVYVSS